MSSIMNIDDEYRQWIEKITLEYRNSQIKAAIKVNVELLAFYWNLGRDIVSMQSQSKWGSKLLENVSKDLKRQLPDAKGFSKTNLFYITSLFSLYSPLANDEKTIPQIEDQFTPQVGEQIAVSPKYGITVQDLFSIPWGHHKLIIDKCGKSLEKACFYVRETLSNNW